MKYIPSTVLARWRSPDRSPIFSQDLQNSSIAVQNTTNNPELGMRVVAFLRNQNFRDVYLSALEFWSVGSPQNSPYLKEVLGFGNLETRKRQQSFLLQLPRECPHPSIGWGGIAN